jgi:DNA-binding transcriptional ArsR family regulator
MDAQPIFSALVEPRRRAILRLVKDQPRAAGEIAENFEVSQQAVSQHLQVLRDAGLVEVRPDGQRRLYVLKPDALHAVTDELAGFWPGALARLKEAVERAEL